MSIKEIVVGGVVTLVIGGSAYTISQADVVNNFAEDTGITQEEAKEYIEGIESELIPLTEVADGYISGGNEIIGIANDIDCYNYEYEWESSDLSCFTGKSQLLKWGNDSVAVGKSYKIMTSESGDRADITTTISLIDILNTDYSMKIIPRLFTANEIDEDKKANSYNKATLQAALQGDEQ